MIVAIHQPNYLPYLGFFEKMKQSDIFVIYDDAQFNKDDFHHRNKIRIFNGWKWLTVPVDQKIIPINKIKIKKGFNKKGSTWNEMHFRILKDNYKNSPYFPLYEKELEIIYLTEYDKLIDLNMCLIHYLKKSFNIKTKLIFSSELGLTSKSTKRLVDIVEILGGDIYLSGKMGRNYLDISYFDDRQIKIEFQEFKHPVYKQQYDGFIPNMSSIDALFNIGKLRESY